jgi:hypothetical protein
MFILFPFIAQGVLMILDEGYFHLRRGLPLWERIGHPLDTLSVCVCIGYALFIPFSFEHLKTYLILAVISCLMVTKDEMVHKHICPRREMWLHAVLFSLHPLILISTALIWSYTTSEAPPVWLNTWLRYPEFLGLFLIGQFFLALGFLFYQIVYWNFIRGKSHEQVSNQQ